MSCARLQTFEQVSPNELVQYLWTGTAKTTSPCRLHKKPVGADVLNVMYQHVSLHCKQCTTSNELEHLGLMVFANPFVNFFIPSSLPLSPSISLSPFLCLSSLHATDVFLSRSNRQESTGKKKGSVFPRREEYKAPSLHTADAESQSICHQLALPHGPERFNTRGDFFSFLTSAYISLCHIHRIKYKHT